jgi:hypothetical protein
VTLFQNRRKGSQNVDPNGLSGEKRVGALWDEAAIDLARETNGFIIAVNNIINQHSFSSNMQPTIKTGIIAKDIPEAIILL